MLISKLIPQCMKLAVMGPTHNMTQSGVFIRKTPGKRTCQRDLLVQHRVNDLFDGQELPLVRRIP